MAARIENNIKLLRKTISSVIRSKRADLRQALKGTMSEFTDEMVAAGLVNDGVLESKDFEIIVNDFLAGLKFVDDLSKLEQQWNTFINILENLGGPSKRAAQQLDDMLKSDHFKGKLECVICHTTTECLLSFVVEKDQETFDGSSNNRKDSSLVANTGISVDIATKLNKVIMFGVSICD